ncbi:MAG TPA: caspase family protein [Thermoanaerobaculia bacterium]|nr:caspase family protein [Thermoanaerobaculia bacterium]
MKRRRLLVLALFLTACGGERLPTDGRSVVRASLTSAPAPRFDPEQSAALFVGIRHFPGDVPQVPYGADDAVDLAYAFAFDTRVSLVPPHRIVLALEGEPQKPESKDRLKKLLTAGATLRPATRQDILTLLEQQAEAARNGLLVASFATHGFSAQGAPYILGSNSHLYGAGSSLPIAKLLEIAAIAPRSFVFIDACRNPEGGPARGLAGPNEKTVAPHLRRLHRMRGQVVFHAAAAGETAHDDHEKKNGVFTAGVLECMRCEVARNGRGVVTGSSLSTYVGEYVLHWIQKNVNPSARTATQMTYDGDTNTMPLALCPPPDPLVEARHDGQRIMAFGQSGAKLWEQSVEEQVSHTEVADLNADGLKEVVASAGKRIHIFQYDSKHTRFDEASAPITTFRTGDLIHGSSNRQIAAAAGSTLLIWDDEGTLLHSYPHAGKIKDILIDRPTSRFGWKLIATAIDPDAPKGQRITVMSIHHKRGQLWFRTLAGEAIEHFEIIDINNDSRRDILVSTTEDRLYLDFEGHDIQVNSVPRSMVAR